MHMSQSLFLSENYSTCFGSITVQWLPDTVVTVVLCSWRWV